MEIGEYNQQPLRIVNYKTVTDSVEDSKQKMNTVNEEYVIHYFEKVVKYKPVTDVESNQNVVEAIPHTFPKKSVALSNHEQTFNIKCNRSITLLKLEC